ncbi:MAG: hypothetical protein HZC42_14820 [Candidatus Eisenbacteria bacterium]|nr:hypothetical protein [Candidatus Eisenbacteria bacterium]
MSLGALACSVALMLTTAIMAHAEVRWSAAAYLGAAWNLPSPLIIRQPGFADLRLRARYDSRAFELPLYYALRLERSTGRAGWAVSFIHHKLHLSDPPAEVGEFAISHGFNLLLVERTWREGRVHRSLGAGVVIAHPENTVRGRKLAEDGGRLGGGYYLAGFAASAAVAREIPLGGGWFAPLEGRVTAAWARVPVAGGQADVPNVAVHGLAGLGCRR